MSKYLDNPVFLCGHRKSGTTMLINLFDNAFEAITYPDDSGFFYKYFPEYELEKYSDQEKIERLCSTIAGEKLTEVISNIDISINHFFDVIFTMLFFIVSCTMNDYIKFFSFK